MPYIPETHREELATGLRMPQDTGELNYTISTLVWEYYTAHGGRYRQINDVLGALEGAKLEFYRRVAAPYEDGKIKENGDVYT